MSAIVSIKTGITYSTGDLVYPYEGADYLIILGKNVFRRCIYNRGVTTNIKIVDWLDIYLTRVENIGYTS